MKEKLLNIIDHYGIDNQLRKFNEEQYELIESIRNYEEQYIVLDCDEVYVAEAKRHIEEEFADVCVILEQFKAFYELDNTNIIKIMNQKIERQLDRISKEEK